MKKSMILVAVAIMAVVFALPAFSAISTPIVRLNLTKNYVITQEQLDQKLADYKEVYGEDVDAATVLDAMVSDQLLAQAMERDGFVLNEDQKNELLAAQKSSIEQQVGQSLTDEQFAYLIAQNYEVDLDYYKEYLAQQYLVQNYVMNNKSGASDAGRPSARPSSGGDRSRGSDRRSASAPVDDDDPYKEIFKIFNRER